MPRRSLQVVPALDGDVWFVESQSQPGVWRCVARTAGGTWSCGCPWGAGAGEQLGAHPCAHLRAVAAHLADLAAGAAA